MSLLFFLFLGIVQGQTNFRPTWAPRDVMKLPCLSYKNLYICKSYAWLTTYANPKVCRDPSEFMCQKPRTGTILAKYANISCPRCLPEGVLHDFCKERVTTKCTSRTALVPTITLTADKMTICPSCHMSLPSLNKSICTSTTLRACAVEMKATGTRPVSCKEGEKPRLTDACCFSCTPASISCVKPTMTRDEAIAKYKTTKECKNGDVPVVTSDCSRSCRNKPTKVRTVLQKCTRAELLRGVINAPVCETDEKPIKDKSILRCGPSCRRTESGFDLKEVVDCIKDLPRCPKGERPLYIPGSMCRTCIRAKPTCPSSCSKSQVCASRSQDFAEYKGQHIKCLIKRTFKMIVKTKPAFASKFKNMTKEQITRVLLEVVERYCERNSEAERCAKLLDRIKDSFECKKKTIRNGDVEVEADVAGTDTDDSVAVRGAKKKNGRRLLSEDQGTQTLIQDSINDDTDNFAGVTVTGNGRATLPGLAILISIIAFLGTN